MIRSSRGLHGKIAQFSAESKALLGGSRIGVSSPKLPSNVRPDTKIDGERAVLEQVF
jgi:hypothetical protein